MILQEQADWRVAVFRDDIITLADTHKSVHLFTFVAANDAMMEMDRIPMMTNNEV